MRSKSGPGGTLYHYGLCELAQRQAVSVRKHKPSGRDIKSDRAKVVMTAGCISRNFNIPNYVHNSMERGNSANQKLSQSNSVAAFGFSYESKHIRICSFVHFSTARSDGRLFLSKNLISVVSIFFSNSPPSYLHRTKIFTTP